MGLRAGGGAADDCGGHAGRVVNVTSILATIPLSGNGPCCAAKVGLDLLTKVMALELAQHGIADRIGAAGDPAGARGVGRGGRAGDRLPRTYVTGSSLLVDGGLALASGPEELQTATGLPASASAEGAA
ncbi:MAG: family oxidoreductase [Conexibacter sp.]|nr:family oxidoreductase [Conexibacter sp.]